MIRLLRIELRRNALLILLPVVGLLWLASPIARHLYPIALWPDRSTDVQSALQALAPFSAGIAAWVAYRERRRGMADLLAATPFDPGRRALAALVATAVWAVLGYLAGMTVMLVITARQATWGHPVIWPLLVGALAVLAATALGFAVGRLAPSRFTAPLAAIGTLGLLAIGAQTAFDGHLVSRIAPLYPTISLDLPVFYPVRADLAVLQLLFAGGVLVCAVAITLLHSGNRRTGLAGGIVGVLLVGLSVGLIGTAHRDQQNATVVPALDTAASQQPLPYTPACSTSPLPVCVHPAYAAKLSIVDDVINRLAAPLLGLPGAPVRATERPINFFDDMTVTGNPPNLIIVPIFIQGNSLGSDQLAGIIETSIALALVDSPGTAPRHATPTQRAVALFLLDQAGDPVDATRLPADPAVRAAAARLAALPATTRHDWLAHHLAALRAGTVTLAELP